MPTARKLPSGNWRTRIYTHTDADGKKHYKSFTASTKKEAERLANTFQFDAKNKNSADMTLFECGELFISGKSGKISPTTERKYDCILRNHLTELHHIKLSRLEKETVQYAVDKFAKGHSPKTVHNTISFYRTACKKYTAVFNDIELPKKEKKEIQIPQEDEIRILLEGTTGNIRTAIALGALAGLRSGEVLALQWDDVQGDMLHIHSSIAYDKDKKMITKAPKSDAGNRIVPISPPLKQILAETERSSKYVVGYKSQVGIYNAFVRNCERLGIKKYRFHDLRHYYASELLAMGIPDKYAMELLGHSTNDTLKYIYQHTMKNKKDEIYADISARFSKKYATKYDTPNQQTAV